MTQFAIHETCYRGADPPLAIVDAKDGRHALDVYSEREGFAPYVDEMAEAVWCDAQGHYGAPFTNTEIVAVPVAPA
jgi:hypothetical protein